jgi:tetratricopeptide (TPR) repeat protein
VKRYLHTIPALFVLALLFFPSEAGANEPGEGVFFKANEAYKEGRFNDAVSGYNRLLQGGLKNGHLYFNLGNAYFRLNQLGQAILNFERARLLMPRDADLRFNLGHARDQATDAIPESEGFLNLVFFWLDSLNLAELFWAFAVANLILWATLLIRLFNRSEWTFYTALITLVFWIVLGTSSGMKWYQTTKDDRAVILPKEVPVLAGPETGDTLLFKLHEGTIVRHERSEDGWSLIRLADKKRGWVQDNAIERIAAKNTSNTPTPSGSS